MHFFLEVVCFVPIISASSCISFQNLEYLKLFQISLIQFFPFPRVYMPFFFLNKILGSYKSSGREFSGLLVASIYSLSVFTVYSDF